GILIPQQRKCVAVVFHAELLYKIVMTSTFKKPNFALIILTFFCLTSNAQIANSKFNLTSETYFQCFSFLLPNNLTRKSHTDNENKFNIIVYENEKDSIDVMIRKKEANTDL